MKHTFTSVVGALAALAALAIVAALAACRADPGFANDDGTEAVSSRGDDAGARSDMCRAMPEKQCPVSDDASDGFVYGLRDLPTGACAPADACSLLVDPCPNWQSNPAQRADGYACACDQGTWTCAMCAQGGGVCLTSNDADAGTAADAAPASCDARDAGPHAVRVSQSGCLTPSTESGFCITSLHMGSTTTERLCALDPQGNLSLVDVNGDDVLTGDGWHFGPRALGYEGTRTYPVEHDTLPPDAERECSAVAAEPACAADGG